MKNVNIDPVQDASYFPRFSSCLKLQLPELKITPAANIYMVDWFFYPGTISIFEDES